MGFELEVMLNDSKVAAAVDDMQEDVLDSTLDLTMIKNFDLSYNFKDSWD